MSDPRDDAGETLRWEEGAIAAENGSTTRRERFSLLIYGRDGARAVKLVGGRPVVLGRGEPSDVTIRDRSLSRQHAVVEVVDGRVWIEDLGSTNGTRVNGHPVERSQARPGDILALGGVTASVHGLGATDQNAPRLENHERLRTELDAEIHRGRLFGRAVGLVMCRSQSGDIPPSHWLPRIDKLRRPFERLALYSNDIVELLSVERSPTELRRLVAGFAQNESLACGVAMFPANGGTGDELLGAARAALQRSVQHGIPYFWDAEMDLDTSAETALGDGGPVVGSASMQQLFAMASRLADSPIPVLILGETGTGKEVLARALHGSEARRKAPFRCVNCGAIPAQLVESTLFGHKRGAFTGALADAPGVFEAAKGGTVFLDEVGELPPAAQAALLRVLESKQVTRVGSNREIAVNARVIAATNQDLEAMCKEGRFREDLLYRLNAMTMTVPPLRDRAEEIIPLSLHFLGAACRANARAPLELSDTVVELLTAYSWPGNVRELRNAMERAAAIAQGDLVVEADLPERLLELAGMRAVTEALDSPQEDAAQSTGGTINLRREMERFEADLILGALERAAGHRETAARELGLPLRTLAHKMRSHGIRRVGSGYARTDDDG